MTEAATFTRCRAKAPDPTLEVGRDASLPTGASPSAVILHGGGGELEDEVVAWADERGSGVVGGAHALPQPDALLSLGAR